MYYCLMYNRKAILYLFYTLFLMYVVFVYVCLCMVALFALADLTGVVMLCTVQTCDVKERGKKKRKALFFYS